MPRGNAVRGLVLIAQEHILVGQEHLEVGQGDALLAGEGLHGVAGDVDGGVFLRAAAALGAADVVVFNAVGAVILRVEPQGAGLELHVEILGDEDRAVGLGIGEVGGAGEDAVVGGIEIREELLGHPAAGRFLDELPVVAFMLDGGIDEDVEPAAVFELHAEAHLLGGAEAFAQAPVDFAGIGAAGGGLGLEAVEFLEHFDGNPDDVFLELEHRLGVVNENVGIEDVMFRRWEVGLFEGHGFFGFQARVISDGSAGG